MTPYMRASNVNFVWEKAKNVEDPETYVDDFSADNGYFVEENGRRNWKIESGMLSVSTQEDLDLCYMHIFEPNVNIKARMRYKNMNPDDSGFGILLRYNALEAYARCGFVVKSGIAFIDSRQGKDFVAERVASKLYKLTEGEWYDIEFTVDGSCASLKINDEAVLSADGIGHLSPGRIAFFANRIDLDIDSVEVTFLSGEGTLWKNVVHHKLPDEQYREGGSVFEMNDGSLTYIHGSGVTFTSKDNGTTWDRAEKPWTATHGYPNILCLANGDFMKIVTLERDGIKYKASQTSSDDGATWVDGGNICYARFQNRQQPEPGKAIAGAGNMNDKVTQIANGRVFYCQNYECSPYAATVDGRTVFCEFYYSDDNGATWTKSETDSWTLGGNDKNNIQWFGECKILECADGTLRMYNSWNDYGCVVYSESKDMGVTWGELVPIPELVCARSSMQFVKDTYADNETTYYMVWVFSPPQSQGSPMSRSRLGLAKSTDGKNWEFIGDIWRWEHRYCHGSQIAHVVDAFVKTTKDYIITGAGYSEHLTDPIEKDTYHHAQRQHVYALKKSDLPKGKPIPPCRGITKM